MTGISNIQNVKLIIIQRIPIRRVCVLTV